MFSRHFYLSCAAVAISVGVSIPSNQAQAAGFYIQEQSSYHLGMAFAGSAADPVDASTIYFNPAGMTELDGPQIQVGTHFIAPDSDLKNTGSTASNSIGGYNGAASGRNSDNPYDVETVPNFFAAYPGSDNGDLWVGFALTAPFGLKNEYNNDFFGRYDSTESALKVIDFAPSVAYRINDKLSIGGGFNIQYSDAKLENALPDSTAAAGPSVATDGLLDLSGDDLATSYNLGLFWKPTEDWRFGLHYKHGSAHDLEGRIISRAPVGLGAGVTRVAGEAELDLPAIATVAGAYDVNDKLTIQGHAIWFGWSSFDDIPVNTPVTDSSTPQEYNDTFALAIGAKYKVDEKWEVRGGFQFDETPTEDGFRSTRTPDGDRMWFALGTSYKFNDKISFDLSGTYIDVDEEEIDLTKDFNYGAGGTASVDINGETEGSVGIIAFGMTYKF